MDAKLIDVLYVDFARQVTEYTELRAALVRVQQELRLRAALIAVYRTFLERAGETPKEPATYERAGTPAEGE